MTPIREKHSEAISGHRWSLREMLLAGLAAWAILWVLLEALPMIVHLAIRLAEAVVFLGLFSGGLCLGLVGLCLVGSYAWKVAKYPFRGLRHAKR